MKTLKLSKTDISKGHLILVNPSHPLKRDMQINQLSPLRPEEANIFLEQQAAKMLMKAITFLECNHKIVPVSGYRTMKEQQEIYKNSLRDNGQDFTQKYVAIPGCSEHQTGLAIDLAKNNNTVDFIRPDFPYNGIYGRFRELSVQFGFIERYPANREQITHIAHEPWHFRYVGYPHSEVIEERVLTLEEYIEYLKQFHYQSNHLCFRRHKRDFEIFYVPVQDNKDSVIEIPDGIPYQVSGNNDDGVVLTLWKELL